MKLVCGCDPPVGSLLMAGLPPICVPAAPVLYCKTSDGAQTPEAGLLEVGWPPEEHDNGCV